ncbi:glutathione S-transferase TAU 19 [Prunus dulcis]|uniref:Glutathione S-transferase TAU 19 n=1 Tax=Prunus dulcis TaxID=3755 RepID=A0A5H2XRJ1_PRUDU|nr:glutathione S-transferase TAU 19 [Prunus dulcis]
MQETNERHVDAQNGPANIESNLVIICAGSSAGKRAEALGEMASDTGVVPAEGSPMPKSVMGSNSGRGSESGNFAQSSNVRLCASRCGGDTCPGD